eukprot:GHUV01034872.1.p1 GENE.GHUV01034872.1~~GHUV01034872.1.p1  ORF type:complete len:787 (+),score=252.04 GHUV01034872.1:587-2947(+)
MLWTAVIWSWHTLTYSIQRVSTFSFSHRLLVLACTSMVHVILGASLYRLVSGDSWSCALFKSYGVLFRAPGFAVSNEPTLAASVVMNTLFIFGLFVFAVLIGMISDEIKQQIHAMRVGDVELRLRGHTLVLNWNGLTLSLLRQLCHAQNDPKHRLYKRPVVVLADRPRADMDLAVYTAMRGFKFEVFVRSGRPSKQQDLQRVAAHTAGTVLLLQPEPCSNEAAAEALKVTTLISLRCLQLTQSNDDRETYYQPGSAKRMLRNITAGMCRCLDSILVSLTGRRMFTLMYIRFSRSSSSFNAALASSKSSRAESMRVVVQVPNIQPQEDDILGFLHSTTASVSNVQGARLLSQRMLDRLVAQTAVQPGTAHAFREILRAGGDSAQLCFCDVDQQLAVTFKAAQQKFTDAVLLGVLVDADRQLLLNPADDYRLQEGDRLLGYTRQARLSPRTGASNRKSSGWPRLGRPMSRASSMSSRGLHVVSSNSNVTTEGLANSHGTSVGPDRPLNLIVVGWSEAAVAGLLSSLQETAPEGSSITVLHQKGQTQPDVEPAAVAAAAVAAATAAAAVIGAASSKHSVADSDTGDDNEQHLPGHVLQQQQGECAETIRQPQQQIACRHVHVAEPCSVQALLNAGIAEADSIVFGGHLAPQASGEADAMVVAALLAVQQALTPAGSAAAASWPSVHRQEPPAGNNSSSSGSNSSKQQSGRSRPLRRSETGAVLQLHVVAVLGSYSLRKAVQVFLGSMLVRNFSYEIMVLDEYAAAMLVQVGALFLTSSCKQGMCSALRC